jgi:Fe-S-cluster-containing dehydrogenase component/DMSO reductase anchor subunit
MWRSVGLLTGTRPPLHNELSTPQPYQQHITTACHHCVEPGCADGCPVLAYEKDPLTGIVRHLDDQCIGCQYCTMKCPYEVPKYSSSKGIVRKCDMCHSRLAGGEAPACAQACPHEAIRIELVTQNAVRSQFNGVRPSSVQDTNPFLPGSPEPRITLPTTRYISARPLPASVRSADAGTLRLEPAHLPLVAMLVLTQLAGGLHLLNAILSSAGWTEPAPALAKAAFGALVAGLAASVAHLGRPLKAWRAFLGWRRSWMSREIIVFSIYAVLTALLVWQPTNAVLAEVTALAALAGIGCSAMIYVDTGRPAWSANAVFTKFFGTALLLGSTAGAMVAAWLSPALSPLLAAIATLIRSVLFAWEWMTLLRARNNPAMSFHRGALTVWSLLRPVLVARLLLFTASTGFSLLAILNAAQQGRIWGILAFAATVAGQVAERYTFFSTCAAPRMPGGVG